MITGAELKTISRPQALLIDDDRFVSISLGKVIEDSGFTLQSISNPTKLTENLVANVSLIILDLMMPHADGVDALKYLSRESYNGAIILVSGLEKSEINTAAFMAEVHKLNVIGALQKPVETARLKSILAKYAYQLHRLERESIATVSISPKALRTALTDGLLTTATALTLQSNDRRVIGGELKADWARETSRIDHGSLCKSASCDSTASYSFSCYMLRQAAEALGSHSALNLETSIRIPAIGLIHGVLESDFMKLLHITRSRTERLFLSIDSNDAKNHKDRIEKASEVLSSAGIDIALDIQELTYTRGLDILRRPFKRVALLHPELPRLGNAKSIEMFVEIAKKQGISTLLGSQDGIKEEHSSIQSCFDFIRLT